MTNDTQTHGFGIIPNWLVRESTVSAYALLVYVALTSRTNRNGDCWPKMRTIAKEARCSQSTARRAIKELCDVGIISVTTRSRASDGGQTSNIYRVLIGNHVPPASQKQAPALSETDQEEESLEEDLSSQELKPPLASGRVSSHSSTHSASEAQIGFLADCFILLHQEVPKRSEYAMWEQMSSAEAHSDIGSYWSEIEQGADYALNDAITAFPTQLSKRATTYINKRLGYDPAETSK